MVLDIRRRGCNICSMSTPEQTVPIMLRARITDAEWAEIRKLAIDEGLHNADLVADLLRRGMAARKAEAAAA